MERRSIQKACQRAAHCGSENLQLLGFEGELHTAHKSQAILSYCLQIRIRVEHAIGLLKGTFQSLKEIRIQLVDAKRHMIIIMWARVCIVLHNLIIRIEGDNVDEGWRECLVRTGLDHEHGANGDTDEEDGPGDVLERARQRIETPGQRFRLELMDDLFNSPSCTVERRP